MDFPQYAELDTALKRAMLFLHLAVEHIRPYDADLADSISTHHFDPLTSLFDRISQNIDKRLRERENQLLPPSELDRISQAAFEDALGDMPYCPPGLGYGALPEAAPHPWGSPKGVQNGRAFRNGDVGVLTSEAVDGELLRALQYTQWGPGGLTMAADSNGAILEDRLSPFDRQSQMAPIRAPASIYSNGDYGVIGERRVSSNSGDSNGMRRSSALASLRQDSEPLPMSSPAISLSSYSVAQATGLKPLPYDSGRFTPKTTPELDEAMHVGKSSSSSPPANRSLSPEARTATVNESPSTVSPEPDIAAPKTATKPAPTSWASIAAIPRTQTAQLPFSGHLTSSLLPTTIRKARRVSTPSEPLRAQLRAVWITNLPATFTIHDVSAQITEGPTMSIIVGEHMFEALSGYSACIIFQYAEHAHAFLVANNNGNPVEPAGTFVLPATLYLAEAPGAYMLRGAPYPADADIAAMAPPKLARRRLKWSRSRLFYDVPLAVFKEDIYEMIGGDNVELFHFYNPGECTVVFASVKVAAACYEKFQTWKKEVAVRDAEGNLLEPLVLGKAGKGGRYERVDVSYVHDFNEAPARLYSQYGPDGRVRKTAIDVGIEGLYSGPIVKGGMV